MKRTILAIAITSLLAGNALANETDNNKGFYLGLEGGISHTKADVKNSNVSEESDGILNGDSFSGNKAVGSVKGGYAFGNGIRGELSYSKYGKLNHDTAFNSVSYGEDETILKDTATKNKEHADNAFESAKNDFGERTSLKETADKNKSMADKAFETAKVDADQRETLKNNSDENLKMAKNAVWNATEDMVKAKNELDAYKNSVDPGFDVNHQEKLKALEDKLEEAKKNAKDLQAVYNQQKELNENANKALEDAKNNLETAKKNAEQQNGLNEEANKALEEAEKNLTEAEKIAKQQDDLYNDAIKAWEGTKQELSSSMKWSVKSDTVMANMYYDFQNDTAFTPYIMAGLGLAHNTLEGRAHVNGFTANAKESKSQLAWQVGVGASYAFTQNLFGDVGVKYTDRGSLAINSADVTDASGKHMGSIDVDHKVKLTSVDTTIGIRYMF